MNDNFAQIDTFQKRMKITIERVGSVAKVARGIGVVEGTVRKYRDGLSEIDRPHLVALAKLADVSVAWLAAGEGNMETSAKNNPVREDSAAYGRSCYRDAVFYVDQSLYAKNRLVDPERKRRLVDLVANMYESSDGEPDHDTINQMIDLVE